MKNILRTNALKFLKLLKNKFHIHYDLIYISLLLLSFLLIYYKILNYVVVPYNLYDYKINSYAINFFNPAKNFDLIFYISSIIIIGLSYCIYYLVKKNKLVSNILSPNAYYFFALVGYTVSLLFIHFENLLNVLLLLALWILFLMPSVTNTLFKKVKNLCYSNSGLNYILASILALSIILFLIQMLSYIIPPPKIMNEFFDIPEITIVKDKNNKKIKIKIDNIEYINENHLFGTHKKYDIRTGIVKSTHCITLPQSDGIDKIIKNQAYNDYFVQRKHPKTTPFKFYYNSNKELCIIGNIGKMEYDILSLNLPDKYLKKLDNLQLTIDNNNNIDANFDDYIKEQFVKANKHEIHWQILNRYYFHHHNHLYGPINELNLGKNLNKIFFQYGIYNGLLLNKIMNKIGGFDFHNYMKILYSSYILYFLGFIVLLFLIFNSNLAYIVPTSLMIFANINYTKDEFLRIAPGTSPLRHIFDLPVFICSYFAFVKKSKIGLILAVIFALCAIFNEVNMGVFISLSLLATIIIKNIVEKHKSKFEITVAIIFTALIIISYLIAKSNVDISVGYFKLGMVAFATKYFKIFMILAIFIIIYAMLMKYFLRNDLIKNDRIYLFTELFLYSQAVMLYFVMISLDDHIYNFVCIYATSLFLLLYLYFSHNKNNIKKVENIILIVCLIFSIVIYTISTSKNYKSIKKFNYVFKTHETYEWKFPHTNFISTMNPKYFIDSVNLIKKYTPENKIYILSKYDSLLPIISGKYSGMPFFEVSNYLISKYDIQLCIDTLLNDKPQYLYIDKDIERDYNIDMISRQSKYFGNLFLESEWRAERLFLMKEIYKIIKRNYEPIESSYLLTVWRRK